MVTVEMIVSSLATSYPLADDLFSGSVNVHPERAIPDPSTTGPPYFALKERRTQFNSSLIASWGSKIEQTQAQSSPEPNEN